MQQKAGADRFAAATAGYYTHSQGARYLSPFSSGARFPQLVELHESLHEYLAHGNWTDALARLFTGVLVNGEGLLLDRHRNEISKLLHTIHANTVYTHELIATYLSILLFASRHPDEVETARAELDVFYREIFSVGSAAFGEVNDPRIDASIITAALACAVAALNPPYPLELVRFDRVSECRRFVEQNSPDGRMREFLQGLHPAWQPHSIFSELQGLPSSEVQARVWSNLRRHFPTIESVTDRPTILQEWVAVLKEDAQSYAYDFMADLALQPNPQGTSADYLGASFENSEGTEKEHEYSLDLSLSSVGFLSGSLSELTTIAMACAEHGLLLHCHVIVIPDKNRALLRCFALNQSGTHAVVPVGIEVAFDELVYTLKGLPRGSLALKIDELWGMKRAPSSASSIASTLALYHPVFVLIEASHPRNLRRLVLNALAEKQKVFLCPIMEDTYGVVLAYLDGDRCAIAAPVTELGLEVLFHEFANSDSVIFAVTDQVIPAAMGISMSAVASVMARCFFKAPRPFDIKNVDYSDLLPGLYEKPSSPWWKLWRT